MSPTLPPTLIKLALSDDGPAARKALSTLYETYQAPVRAYIFRWRHGSAFTAEQVDDLMQEFFSLRIEKLDLVRNWEPERTRFRTWLFAALNYFLLNHLGRDARARLHVSYDDAAHAIADARTPERLLAGVWARDWARSLIDHASAELRAAHERKGQIELHDALRPYLGIATNRAEDPPYAELSKRLGKSVVALRGHMHKMRRFWQAAVKELVRQTVPEDEVQSELELLISALEERDPAALPAPPARRRAAPACEGAA